MRLQAEGRQVGGEGAGGLEGQREQVNDELNSNFIFFLVLKIIEIIPSAFGDTP